MRLIYHASIRITNIASNQGLPQGGGGKGAIAPWKFLTTSIL